MTRNILTEQTLLCTPGLLHANRPETAPGPWQLWSSTQQCGTAFLPRGKGCKSKSPEIKHASSARNHQISHNPAAQGSQRGCEQLLLNLCYSHISPAPWELQQHSSPALHESKAAQKPPQPTPATNRAFTGVSLSVTL